jgi:hypothetical protein
VLDEKKCSIFDPEQKSFRSGKMYCLEHKIIFKMIIDDTMTYRKELYVTTFDFKDVSDSFPHELLDYTLIKAGFKKMMI